jgi:hypothetical protein
MKKSIAILVALALASAAAYAEIGLGAAAFFKSPVLVGQTIDVDNLNVDQFSFGADARFKLGWFQAEGILLYSVGAVDSLNAYLDAGIALDLAIVRLSLGAGPNFYGTVGHGDAAQAGVNAKLGADVKIGAISVGLSYIMALSIDNGIYLNSGSGLLGLQVLIWL